MVAVVVCHRRMRTATNFFLTNLAVADLGVGLFCVYQNLSLYILEEEWAFGDALCKMYHFIHALSYTASVLIMVAVAVERYIAIVYPIKAKGFLRMRNLKYSMIGIWLMSVLICLPRLWMFGLMELPFTNESGKQESICVLQWSFYDKKYYHTFVFIVLFVIPVCVMVFVYVKLGTRLYASDVSVPEATTTCPPDVSKHSAQQYSACSTIVKTAPAVNMKHHVNVQLTQNQQNPHLLPSHHNKRHSHPRRQSELNVTQNHHNMSLRRHNRSEVNDDQEDYDQNTVYSNQSSYDGSDENLDWRSILQRSVVYTCCKAMRDYCCKNQRGEEASMDQVTVNSCKDIANITRRNSPSPSAATRNLPKKSSPEISPLLHQKKVSHDHHHEPPYLETTFGKYRLCVSFCLEKTIVIRKSHHQIV